MGCNRALVGLVPNKSFKQGKPYKGPMKTWRSQGPRQTHMTCTRVAQVGLRSMSIPPTPKRSATRWLGIL